MKTPNIFTNPELMHPAPEVVLTLIKKHGGMTMTAIHALGYRSIYGSLDHLLSENLIFAHPLPTTIPGGLPENVYLPNT